MSGSSRRLAVVASAFAVLALTATACSEPTAESQVVTEDGGSFDLSPEQADRVRAQKVDDIAAEVPQAIRDRGTLIVTGAGGTAPPLRFYATDEEREAWEEESILPLPPSEPPPFPRKMPRRPA